jgi:NADH:ubiquinone oxidoreductase subunit K
MDPAQIYVVVSGVCLVIGVIALYIVRRRRELSLMTPLTGLGLGFFLVGVLFGQNQFSGYFFIAMGIILAAADLIRKKKPE